MRGIHEIARNALGPIYGPLRDLCWSVFGLSERTAALWLACHALVGLAIYLRSERGPGNPSWAGFLRSLFPREIYAHPSARADYVFFAVDKLVIFATLAILPLSGDAVTREILSLVPAQPAAAARPWGTVLMTVAVFLAFDLGAFVWHFLTHRVRVLWAFHRVHHAAEVLTPLSNYREHPVDSIGRSLVQGALIGVAQAALRLALPSAQPLEVFGINAVYVPFFVLANARHSHLWVGFGRVWSRVFISPAQHQCHHGTAPRHIDVNYGLVLAVWDSVSGSLYVPREREEVRYGLVGETQPFPTVLSMYLRPFRDAFRQPQAGAGESQRHARSAIQPAR